MSTLHNILVVEDDDVMRRMIRFTLRDAGFHVIEAADGAAALEALDRITPDLVLLDLILPDADGIELARRMRESLDPTIAIVGLSGYLTDTSPHEVRGLGLSELLVKPVEPSRIVSTVASYVSSHPPAPERVGKGRKVLLVDDDAMQRKVLALELMQHGFEVTIATDGKMGLELARSVAPDAVLSDVVMPEMDGFELCLELRRDPKLATVPVLLSSATCRDEEDRAFGLDVGASAFLFRNGSPTEGVIEALTAALQEGGRVVGVDTLARFGGEHARRMNHYLSRQRAHADAIARRARWQGAVLGVLRGMSEAISSGESTQGAIQAGLSTSLLAAAVHAGAVFLLDPVRGPVLAACHGIGALEEDRLRREKPSARFIEAVLRLRGPVVITELEGCASEAAALARSIGKRLVIVTPLMGGSAPIGVLVVGADPGVCARSELIAFSHAVGVQLGQALALDQAFQRVASSESRYRTLMEHASDAILLQNAEGVVVESNRRAELFLGRPRGQIVGHHLAELLPPPMPREGGPGEPEDTSIGRRSGWIRRPDGTVAAFEASTSMVSVEGSFVFTTIARDVTGRRVEERRARAVQAATRSLANADSLADALPRVISALTEAVEAHCGAFCSNDERTLRSWHCGCAPELMERVRAAAGGEAMMVRLERDIPAEGAQLKMVLALPIERGTVHHGLLQLFFAVEPYAAGELLAALGGVVSEIALFIEREQTRLALRASEARQTYLLKEAPMAVYSSVFEGPMPQVAISENIERLTGFPAELVAQNEFWQAHLHPEDAERAMEVIATVTAGRPATNEYRFVCADGQYRWFLNQSVPVFDEDGQVKKIVGSILDVNERHRATEARAELEAQLREAQKVEALGRLAGGIAHDFNNMLAAISMNAELAQDEIPADSQPHQDLQEIRRAAMRAGELTRQLLAFSRRQVLEPRVIDLNVALRDIQKMLGRVIGEDIQLSTSLGASNAHIKIDPSQLEQVVLNLVINARDAMPEGGRLFLETRSEDVHGLEAKESPPFAAGRYVVLRVTDTGCGMDAATQQRAFEPFFTTKPKGKGTGLGLATSYGIVRQSGGWIRLRSAVGEGTTFEILLPSVDDAVDPLPSELPAPQGGTESLLLVEDDALVRAPLCKMLAALGYTVLEATTPQHALQMVADRERPVDLVLTDVVMPGGSGPELVSALRSQQPDLRFVLMSGFTDHPSLMNGTLEHGTHFISKPFTSAEIARKLRAALDERARNSDTTPEEAA